MNGKKRGSVKHFTSLTEWREEVINYACDLMIENYNTAIMLKPDNKKYIGDFWTFCI